MNVVIYFSPSNQSKMIASYFSKALSYDLYDITSYNLRNNFEFNFTYHNIVLSFPVYSQNIPLPVLDFLKRIKTDNYILLVTYGKMGMGNVLFEASKNIKGNLIGGAYIPSKHTYKANGDFIEYDKLDILVNRIKNNENFEFDIPKLPKNIFANFFPSLRSKFAVRISKNINCISCNKCSSLCPVNAIISGNINYKCIRCLSCFNNCPTKGLSITYSRLLKLYLKKDKVNKLLIY